MLRSLLLVQLIKTIDRVAQDKFKQNKKDDIILASKYIHGIRKTECSTDSIEFNDGLNIRPGRLLDQSI